MRYYKGVGVLAALLLTGTSQAATFIPASASTPTLIGTFKAGLLYFTATGSASLTGNAGFDVDANGVPLRGSVTDPNYQYFNPNGSFTADGSFGPAGSRVKIGALAITTTADGSSGYTFLGTRRTLGFFSTVQLYGLVNDTNASNNTGGFTVDVVAVPEPATWAMMISGFGFVGGAMRSRRRQQVRITYA